jgi:predicted alpha/beta superfamily hydrolase
MRPPEVFDVDSTAIGDQLRVTVSPGDPGAPVLYVLDPILLFDLVVAIATMLRTAARFTGGPFPSLTVVGIGYPTDDPGAVFALRARDLTPTDGATTTLFPLPPLPFGGAAAFLTALADEVVPQVERRYEIDPTRRALAGVSFGGLFGLYTLFHRPELFFGYMVGSPSLWWDEGLAARWEEAWERKHRDLPARILLSAGANEQTAGDTWKNEGFPLEILQRAAEVDRVRGLADRLRGRSYPNLHLEEAVFADEYHLTAPPAMLTRGLLHHLRGRGGNLGACFLPGEKP